MLRTSFAVLYIILTALLIGFIVKAAGSRSKMAGPVIKVIFAGAMTALFYALYLLAAGYGRQPACFLLGMYWLADILAYGLCDGVYRGQAGYKTAQSYSVCYGAARFHKYPGE